VLQIFINSMHPQAVMGIGGLLCLCCTVLFAIQAVFAKSYRIPLVLLCASTLLGAVSLYCSVRLFEDFSQIHTLTSLLLSGASFLSAMTGLTLLYRPDFLQRSSLRFTAPAGIGIVLCIALGYLIWPDGVEARNWNNLTQFVVSLIAAGIIFSAKDPLAPAMRWCTFAFAVFSTLGMLPRLLSLLADQPAEALSTAIIDTPAYRTRAIVWALMPVLLYACVTGVIHARIASKLRLSVNHDLLTGAFSRRYLFEHGEHALLRLLDKTNPSPTVLMIDIDHFKQVNDQYGHGVGDLVLKHCVECIRKVVRQDDAIICRYGGEEFCVFAPQLSEPHARAMAQRICEAIAANPCVINEHSIALSVSIGVAQDPSPATLDALIHVADERLYEAKRRGRNQVVAHGEVAVLGEVAVAG
jgi:diguanylate cyclase (GGDEF)-like protein